MAQPTSGAKPVCFTLPEASRLRDSVNALPLVRREARAWQQAAGQYRAAADSGRAALTAQVAATRQLGAVLADERLLRANDQAIADVWKTRARRRGLLNYLGLAAAGGAAYLLFIR